MPCRWGVRVIAPGQYNTPRVVNQHHVLTHCVSTGASMKTVGERIRQARKARGWTAEKLAELVGYSHQSAIANLENQATTSGGHRLAQIAAALTVSPDWLLSGPDSDNVPFLPPKYVVATPSGPAKSAQEPALDWPFQRVGLTRLNRLLDQLGSADRARALDEIDRHLDIMVERWEREAQELKKQDVA